jgi:hypothetical protein
VTNEPRVCDNLNEAEYHSHPALSFSGAKKLLPPNCPALFKHNRDHGQPHKAAFDFGHAAHKLVLGAGSDLVVIDADSWRTKAAQEAQKAAYADGKTPLLAEEMAKVEDMAAAIRGNPIAVALFDPANGKPEQSLFWQHHSGVNLRGRVDWLPNSRDGRMILPDYKTTVSAEPAAFAKSCASYGYAQQAAFYTDGVIALGLAEDVAFIFVAQEKTAPYLVSIFELDTEALRIGRALNEQAIEVYAECMATDTWPSYSDDVVRLSLPRWFTYQHASLMETA